MLVDGLDEFLDLDVIGRAKVRILMNWWIKLKSCSKFRVLYYQIFYSVILIVIFVRRQKHVSFVSSIGWAILIRLISFWSLPMLWQRIWSKINKYLIPLSLLCIDLELQFFLQLLHQLRVNLAFFLYQKANIELFRVNVIWLYKRILYYLYHSILSHWLLLFFLLFLLFLLLLAVCGLNIA